jgi:hypothetical protein
MSEPKSTDSKTAGVAKPFPESLCWRCANHREIKAARSTFLMCSALTTKYPRQPVATCSAFREDFSRS